MVADVRWPIARREDGSLCPVEDAVRGHIYMCPDCSSPMVPKLGDVLAHHFAHKAEQARCNAEAGYEGPLHAMVKHVIEQKFSTPQALNARPASAVASCAVCGRGLQLGSLVFRAAGGARVDADVAHVTTDVLVTASPASVAFEVVVRQSLDLEKVAALNLAGIAVVEVRVNDTWNTRDPCSRRMSVAAVRDWLRTEMREGGDVTLEWHLPDDVVFPRSSHRCGPWARVGIGTTPCWYCSRETTVVDWLDGWPFVPQDPPEINNTPQELSRLMSELSGGTFFDDRSRSQGRRFLMNHCPTHKHKLLRVERSALSTWRERLIEFQLVPGDLELLKTLRGPAFAANLAERLSLGVPAIEPLLSVVAESPADNLSCQSDRATD